MITRNVLGLALSAVFLTFVTTNCDDGGNTLSSDGGNSGADAEAGGANGTGTGTGGDGGTASGDASATGGAVATGGASATGGAAAGGMGGQRTGGAQGTGGVRTGGAPGTGGSPIVDLTCNPGATCQANATCNGACQAQQGGLGSRACSCVDGKLFCSLQCNPVNVGSPTACPANPQGAACGSVTTNCQIGQNPRDNCVCLSNKLVCPTEPPPANTPVCAANPNFMTCPTEGAFCSRNNGDEFCYCTTVGGNQRWLCQFPR